MTGVLQLLFNCMGKKKVKLSREDLKLLEDFVKQLPKIPLMIKGKDDKWEIKLTKTIYTGTICIAQGFNQGKDSNGNPFEPHKRYGWELPSYYNTAKILKEAFVENGQKGLVDAFKSLQDKYNLYLEYQGIDTNKKTLPEDKVVDDTKEIIPE